MKLIDFAPDESLGGDWRIPTRTELQDFLNKLNAEGRLDEIGEIGYPCEWSNDARDEKMAYARGKSSDPLDRLTIRPLNKSYVCGVRLVSDSIK